MRHENIRTSLGMNALRDVHKFTGKAAVLLDFVRSRLSGKTMINNKCLWRMALGKPKAALHGYHRTRTPFP